MPTEGGISDGNPANGDGGGGVGGGGGGVGVGVGGKRVIFADLRAGRRQGYICRCKLLSRVHYVTVVDTMWVTPCVCWMQI